MLSRSKGYLLCFIAILSFGCAKEDLPINKMSVESLSTSYVQLDEKTVEIPSDMHQEIVVDRTDNMLILKQSNLTLDIEEGSYIVSAMDTPREDVLLRKVLAVDVQGDELILQTELAHTVEVYSRYYIDSKFTDLVTFREPKNLSTIFEFGSSLFTQIINSALEKDSSDMSTDFAFIIEGVPNFKAIHPNTAYEIFAGSGANIDTTDTDGDNLWDVTEAHFTNLSPEIEDNGFYTVEITDFGIKTMKATLQYSLGAYESGDVKGLEGLQPGDLLKNVKNFAKAEIDKRQPDQFKLKYLPLGSVGVFTVNAVIGPVLSLTGDISLFSNFEANFPNKINIQFGHLDWNSTIIDTDLDIEFYTGTAEHKSIVGFSSIFNGGTGNASFGIKGALSADLGFSIGVAGSTGEANLAGASVGFMMPITINNKYSAQGAVQFTDVFNFKSENISFSGQLCTDLSIGASVTVFSDANLGSSLVDKLFDYSLEVPESILPPLRISLFQGQPAYTSDGLCWGYDLCNEIEFSYFNIALDNAEGKKIAFRFDANLNQKFNIEISSGNSVFNVPGDFEFNKDFILNLSISDTYIDGITNGTFRVKVIIPSICDKTFAPEVGFLLFNCMGTYRVANDSELDYQASNLADEVISYFEYDDAQSYLTGKSITLPTLKYAKQYFDSACSNPSGWRLYDPKTNAYRIVDTEKTYIWIERQTTNHNVLEVSYKLEGSTITPSYTTYNAAASVMAALIN